MISKFLLDNHLTKHKEIHHFKTCLKPLNMLSQLKTHKKVHTGEKPHLFKTCDLTFMFKVDMKTHGGFQNWSDIVNRHFY